MSETRPVIDGLGACHLTCGEVESIAQILRESWHEDIADRLIAEHAEGDDDPEDMHHDRYNTNHKCLTEDRLP